MIFNNIFDITYNFIISDYIDYNGDYTDELQKIQVLIGVIIL